MNTACINFRRTVGTACESQKNAASDFLARNVLKWPGADMPVMVLRVVQFL